MAAISVGWHDPSVSINRGSVTAAQRGARTLLQLRLLSGEAKDRVELMLPYGMSALPSGGDAVIAEVGDVRDQMVVLVVDDPTKRIKDLAAGEFGFSDGASLLVFRGQFLQMASTKPVLVQSDQVVDVVAPLLHLGAAGETLYRLIDERFVALFNAHTHPDAQGGTTGAPNQTIAIGAQTTTATYAG